MIQVRFSEAIKEALRPTCGADLAFEKGMIELGPLAMLAALALNRLDHFVNGVGESYATIAGKRVPIKIVVGSNGYYFDVPSEGAP